MLTERFDYKIFIDGIGQYIHENKNYNILSLRLYLFKEKQDLNRQLGIELSSMGGDQYDLMVDELAEKFDKWLRDHKLEPIDLKDYMLNNESVKRRFDKFLEIPYQALKSEMLDPVEMNYSERRKL